MVTWASVVSAVASGSDNSARTITTGKVTSGNRLYCKELNAKRPATAIATQKAIAILEYLIAKRDRFIAFIDG